MSGLTRDTAEVISTHDGGPAYGGTPSDAAVLAAIADLKARGIAVTLYPLVLMDVPEGNALPNGYGGTGQPNYPWRGRITCDPAPGQGGSPDATDGVTAQVDAFVGDAEDWGFRRMVLHYAQLADDAGGADAFLIGSEMRGMSFLREGSNGFPFVSALVDLAAEVRGIVGADTKITYGADWSEFTGLQPGDAPGDKYFHLDELWASADIDAIGIDNYMPLADWRDGTDHADAASAGGPYEVAYLKGNIAGGEGYDWYYASDADRVAGERTPILDGGYGEPWVWRYKDLVGWWSHAHHNRIGGVRQAGATAWVPGSKPIWFTELGCAATDKGANQPNIFGDRKSSENGSPYFSNGAPDGLAQRQFLRAHFGWWRPEAAGFDDARNPASDAYDGRMLDAERIYLWTWDARPYPAFPAEAGVWSDAVNHETGHWLTGRLGAAASDERALAIARDFSVELEAVQPAAPLLHGLVVEGIVSARDALAPVSAACGLTVRETASGLAMGRARLRGALEVEAEDLAVTDRPIASRRRADPSEALGQLGLTYTDRVRGYLTGTATALNLDGAAVAGEATPLVLDIGGARTVAERMLIDRSAGGDTLEVALPPSAAGLEAGDVVTTGGAGEGPYEITEIRDGEVRRISARALAPEIRPVIGAERPNAVSRVVLPRAIPLITVAHLPPTSENLSASRLCIVAEADPWPGDIVIRPEVGGSELGRVRRPGHAGELIAALEAGPAVGWDESSEMTILLRSGHLASAEDEAVLAGANRVAVETDGGAWEVIGFADAELVAPRTYVLNRLLRGQMGTDYAIGPAAAGNRVIVLNERVAQAPVPPQWLGETLALRAYAGRSDASGIGFEVALNAAPALPLAPADLQAVREVGTGDIVFSWTRRSHADGDGWGPGEAPLEFAPESYLVTIMADGVAVRVIESAVATATYSAAEQTADFGALPDSFAFTVQQVSAVLGAGHASEGTFDD